MWRSKARVFLLRSLLPVPSPTLQHIPFRTVSPPLPPLPSCSHPTPGLRSGLFRFLSFDSDATAAGFSQEPDLREEDASVKEAVYSADASSSTDSDDKWGLSAGKSTECSVFPDVSDEAGSMLGSVEGSGLDVMVERHSAALGEDGDGSEKESVDGVGLKNDIEWEEHQEEAAGTAEIDMEKVQNVVSTLQDALPEVLESLLDEMDLAINEEFVISVLQAVSASSIDNLIMFFRYATRSSDFIMNTATLLELLVEKIQSTRDLNRHDAFMLWDLVRDLGEERKESLNTKILNQVISYFSKLGNGKYVVEVFNKFDEFGCLPDGDTYYHTILALGKPSWADTALTVSENMIASGKFPDGDKVGKIIKFFCKGGKLSMAQRVYTTAKDMGQSPPAQYINTLVRHLSDHEDTLEMALQILEHLPKKTLNKAASSFLSAISGLCRINHTEKAKNLLQRMIESGPTPRNAAFNEVITALCKADEIDDAVSLLRKMKKMKSRPDIRAYNVLMAAFSKGGLMEEAKEIFDEAKKVHKKLGRVSYHILSRGYCRINDFENAISWMHMMAEEGIEPNTDDYRKMIQTLCLNSMDWRTAESLLQEMNDSGLFLDEQTRSLIFAVKQLEQEEMRSVGLISRT